MALFGRKEKPIGRMGVKKTLEEPDFSDIPPELAAPKPRRGRKPRKAPKGLDYIPEPPTPEEPLEPEEEPIATQRKQYSKSARLGMVKSELMDLYQYTIPAILEVLEEIRLEEKEEEGK